MKYRKRPVVVDAVQWHPGVLIEGVKECAPEIVLARNEKLFYLSGFYPDQRNADAWLPAGDEKESYPFAFYEIKSARRYPAALGEKLTERALKEMGRPTLPPTYGLIETLEGRMTVDDGDWVITGVKGEKYPCKPDIFAETYEAAE